MASYHHIQRDIEVRIRVHKEDAQRASSEVVRQWHQEQIDDLREAILAVHRARMTGCKHPETGEWVKTY